MTFSGMAVPELSMPLPARIISNIEPLTHALYAMFDVFLRQVHASAIFSVCALLAVYPLVARCWCVIACRRGWKRERRMKLYWQTFVKVLLGMLERPVWLMLILSLCIMSMVYANRTVWDLPVGVVDQDHSTASRQLIRQLDATSKIAIETYDSPEQAQRDLSWRKLFAVIIMPVDLEKKILSGQNIVVPVYGDATNRG